MKISKILDWEETNGTSFYGDELFCTVNQLKKVLGEPMFEENFGDEKSNIEWDCKLEDGTVFTVYDWKLFRPIGYDELIPFHIGGFTNTETYKAKQLIESKL